MSPSPDPKLDVLGALGLARSRRHLPIVEQLRQERLRQGLSQREVAQRMGCSQQYVFLLEAGTKTPMLPMLHRWADALGFDLVLVKKEDRDG